MINPEFRKKVFELDQDQPLNRQVLGAKKFDYEKNVEGEEKKVTIIYYIIVFIWIEILFLSFVLNSNFIGDYNNFLDEPLVISENLSNESQYSTLLAKSKALLSFTIIVGVVSLFEIVAVHKLSKQIVNIASITTGFFYLIRFILGIVFLTDSQKNGMFNEKSNLDTVISSRSDYCYDGQPSEIKQCRYVYSFNFFYGQEIFLLVTATLLLIPFILVSQKFKNQKTLQLQREEMARKREQNVPQNFTVGIQQDLNETKDYLRKENESQNTSILQENYVLQQRTIPLDKEESYSQSKNYISSKQYLPNK